MNSSDAYYEAPACDGPDSEVDGWCERCQRAATDECAREHGRNVVAHEEGK